ncbi:MAG: ATP-binding protein [Clostridiaceae bacterium]
MQNKNEVEKIIYMDRGELHEIGKISVLITCLIIVFCLFFQDLASNILRLINIVISLSIMILAYSTANILQNQYFKFFSITFFITAFVNMAELIPEEYIIRSFHYNFYPVYLQVLCDGLIAVLWIYTPYFLSNSSRKSVKLKYWITTLAAACAYFLMAAMIENLYIFGLIFNIVVIILFVYSLLSSQQFPVNKEKEVNYFKLYSYFLLYFYFLNTIQYIFLKQNDNLIPEYFIKLAAYLIFYGCILHKLLKNPYVLLFNDLYTRNIELNTLNEKISSKNMELELSQMAIHEREEMYRSLFKNIPQSMLIINASNARIIFANTAFQNYLKKKNLKSIINRKLTDLVRFSDEKLFASENNRINYKEIYEGTINMDEEHNLELQFFEVFDEEGQALVVLNDITEEVRIGKIQMEVEKKRLEEKIREDFLSSISHDLKTPLNVVYSASQLLTLLLSKGNYTEARRYNVISKDNCLSLIRLTNNLIDSSRLSSKYLKANLELCNIVEVIEDHVMNLAEYVKAKDVELIFDTTEEEIYVKLDREFIERIILNLISNALKYTPPKGKILVSVSCEINLAKVSITDTGIGMEKEFVEEAFNRFAQGKNNSKINVAGNGIGLYVVKNLTELMGGNIDIESSLGKGTNITLTFKRSKIYVNENFRES